MPVEVNVFCLPLGPCLESEFLFGSDPDFDSNGKIIDQHSLGSLLLHRLSLEHHLW